MQVVRAQAFPQWFFSWLEPEATWGLQPSPHLEPLLLARRAFPEASAALRAVAAGLAATTQALVSLLGAPPHPGPSIRLEGRRGVSGNSDTECILDRRDVWR